MKRIIVLFVLSLALEACVFHSVDPNIPYRYAELTPTVAPDEEVVTGELPPLPGEEGVDEPDIAPPDPACDFVKANINAKGEKIAHVPGDPNYNQVLIDESKGEKFFCTLEEAVAEGWRPVNK